MFVRREEKNGERTEEGKERAGEVCACWGKDKNRRLLYSPNEALAERREK